MNEILELQTGTVLFREGDEGDCAFLVEQGAVRITTETKGAPHLMCITGPGEIIGEMALIDDSPRSATVTVERDARLRIIRKDQLRSRLEQADPVIFLMMRVVTDRLRYTMKLIADKHAPGAVISNTDTDKAAEAVIKKFRLETELRHAILSEELLVHYQPIIDLQSGTCVGSEALVRWPHESMGFVAPELFVALSEETGLIRELGNFVMGRAISDLHGLTGKIDSAAQLYVGINVSQLQLSDTTFLNHVLELVENAHLNPEQIKLELTESHLAGDVDTANWIKQAKSNGFSVLLDDFGTGYSSLSQLMGLEIDVVKIDQSFVVGMGSSDKALNMVRAIVAMANALEMKIVAEGIESEKQRSLLADMGCHFGQGYMLGKPMSFDDYADFLRAESSRGGSA